MHNVSFFMIGIRPVSFFFFFNDTATTEIYTLSLHDALPISNSSRRRSPSRRTCAGRRSRGPRRLRRSESGGTAYFPKRVRSEEHTSELQSRLHLVCRLLLEKKKKIRTLYMLTTTCYVLIIYS